MRAAAILLAIACLYAGCKRRQETEEANKFKQTQQSGEVVPITNMILVKAGSFVRGTQKVTLTHDYWLGKYEVTQREYVGVAGKNPSHFTNDINLPVEKLTFFDASAYCTEMTRREKAAGHLPPGFVYRLPTEAEWEYACRAGTTNNFYFGEATNSEEYAWTLENSEATTHPVGLKKPNGWGFYDIHGNVWEWCSDWFELYPSGDLVDPRGPSTGKFKVFRGGGWNHEAKFAGARNRFMMPPSNGIYFVGFRIVLSQSGN